MLKFAFTIKCNNKKWLIFFKDHLLHVASRIPGLFSSFFLCLTWITSRENFMQKVNLRCHKILHKIFTLRKTVEFSNQLKHKFTQTMKSKLKVIWQHNRVLWCDKRKFAISVWSNCKPSSIYTFSFSLYFLIFIPSTIKIYQSISICYGEMVQHLN